MQDFEIIGEVTDIETIAVGRRIMRPQPETSRRESPRTIPDYLSNFFQIAIVCLVATLVANAGEQLTTKAKSVVNLPTNAELQLLQGTWEGVMVGQEKDGKITITISSNSLHFHRDTNFWFETTFTQPVGTGPKQLHATIKDCAGKHSWAK